MNQTQITYFKNKVNAAKQLVSELLWDGKKEGAKLTNEEKVAQIQSGKARFRVEDFAGRGCPRGMSDLFRFFDFEGEDEIMAKNDLIHRQTERIVAKAKREADKIELQFVLEKLKDPAKALDDYITKYTAIAEKED